MKLLRIILPIALALTVTNPVMAQVSRATHHRALAPHIIVPQSRIFSGTRAEVVEVSSVTVAVEIVEQVATTTMDISLTNESNARLDAEVIVPVPNGAVLRGFTFDGTASEPTAELLPRDEARRLYDAIVAKVRDPALLEFMGYNSIRSSVFPVQPRAAQRIRVSYEEILTADGARVDYVLPRSESIDYRVPWKISLRVASRAPVATVYSPSHNIHTTRLGSRRLNVQLAEDATLEPGPFRLSYLLQKEAITASLLAYPDPKIGGGYFLLLAGTPAVRVQDRAEAQKREVILVLDRSGSMAGEKLEQVRAAALQVLEGLEEGEAFNIIVYHESVESFAPEAVIKNRDTMRAARAYLKSIQIRGGTNLHDALVEALRGRPTKGMLPIVLFLTDGLPTVGETSEVAIREVATKANRYERRIFTFGVGVDVNTPLLDRIAAETRAAATFVLPREDVEVKVGQVFKRLAGPVLSAPNLKVVTPRGAAAIAPGRVHDLLPGKLPDLFEDDQLVVLGQYVGDEPLKFVLEGDYFGRPRTFEFAFSLEKASTRNAFVPRLWASRKIAVLVDAIRDRGADRDPATVASAAPRDSRVQELVDEIVRLSKDFGILTEYTAFLAREGTDLSRPALVMDEAARNFAERAMNTRWGYGSVNQDLNNSYQRSQKCVNFRNSFLDDKMNRVAISTVQQINDRAFYKRGNRWVDSRLVGRSGTGPSRTVEVGSDAFRQLAAKLAAQNRQGCVTLQGEILLEVDGETILVK